MKKLVVLGLITSAAWIVQAQAQDVQGLVSDFQSMQNSVAHVGKDIDMVVSALMKQIQENEAQKETLIEWLKQAQAENKH